MNNKTKNGIKRLRSKNGMTLVEVLVAMTLLVLIIMVFTPLFMTYFRNTRTAGQVTRKTYERSSIMERLIANPDGSNDTGYETAVANMPITLSAGSTTITRDAIFSNCPDATTAPPVLQGDTAGASSPPYRPDGG